ncbi:guanine deaminase [Modestobacter sp. DSM 44400]|uniref:guanine deaminase n=1 Tax=Modestobacter sp. DSM 44400 TaxID=1550230 RepID=UPI000898D585|nr:guanine deaminase [Modestobacter sp. DSM 44400]SDX98840.1 guanine deaminase [Modestobacter sp. DSM 44400]
MTLFRGTVLDTPDDPFTGGALRAEADAGLLVRAGVIVERGSFAELRGRHAEEDVVDLTGGLVLPGFVDTHVHFPQVRAIGGLGMPLMDWLERCALPEEVRLADEHYARAVAGEFISGLAQAGTTTALVFGAHFAGAVDALFAEAARVGLRLTSGLVVSDRLLPEELLTTPQRAHDEGLALARRWHGVGRNRYAVTPRFSLSCGDALLDSCGSLQRDVPGAWFTSHINENAVEIATVAELFPGCHYLDTYDRHDLIGRRSVLAHNVHPTDEELQLLAHRGASVAHCPTSNAALGSGIFSLKRHLASGVRVALGSDVGAGTGFCLLKEGLQAYFLQQLLGGEGQQLAAAQLLHLATAAGAEALGLEEVGDLNVGKRFDAVWIRPRPGTTLDVGLRNAAGTEEALAKAFALGSPADIDSVWIDGEPLHTVSAGGGSSTPAPTHRPPAAAPVG